MYKSKYPSLIDFLTNQEDLILLDSEIQNIENLIDKDLKKQCDIHGVVSSKPKPKSLRQIIEERRTNLCLTAEILKRDGKNETFFIGKYELLDNILNEFDGIEEAN